MIDTLQLARDLEKDFTPAQAETLTRAFSRTVVEELATKTDLKAEILQLEMRLKSEINDVRGEINDVRGEINSVRGEIKDVRGEIKDVRVEIKDAKIDIVRWIVGALLVNIFGVAGSMIALIKNIH